MKIGSGGKIYKTPDDKSKAARPNHFVPFEVVVVLLEFLLNKYFSSLDFY